MRPIRVMVVDDSAVARRLTSETLAVDPAIDVVGTAPTGHLALTRAASLRPDVVTLDGSLRDGDALDVLRTLKREHPGLVVLLVTEPTEAGAALALEALDAGADDVVTEPQSAGGVVAAQRMLLTQLVPRVKELGRPRRSTPLPPGLRDTRPFAPGGGPAAPAGPPVSPELAEVLAASGVHLPGTGPPVQPAPRPRNRPYTLIAIGASTGGPEALAAVFRTLGEGLRVPVLVAQHMPPNFTKLLAERLDGLGPLTVREAVDGDVLAPGLALVAPGDQHLEVHREGPRLVVRLTKGPRENFVRPAVDVLFRTAAQTCGAGVLAAVLTGMGRDGTEGARLIREAGGSVLAQDRRSSVVWGMPGAVTEAGLADEVLPLAQIGAALRNRSLARV